MMIQNKLKFTKKKIMDGTTKWFDESMYMWEWMKFNINEKQDDYRNSL